MAWWPGGRMMAKAFFTSFCMKASAITMAHPADTMCASVTRLSTSGTQK
jgi:hypothetical protein